MDSIAKKIMAANSAIPSADIRAALDYVAACRPDGWCDGEPDAIVWQGRTCGTMPALPAWLLMAAAFSSACITCRRRKCLRAPVSRGL